MSRAAQGVEDAYATFLATADVTTWAACLEQLMARGSPEAGDRARALCVAVYLEWLARISGDEQVRHRAAAEVVRLRAEVQRGGPPTGPEELLCWVPLLIHGGYARHATRLLDAVAEKRPLLVAGPEWRVLSHSRRDVTTLLGLGDLVRVSAPTGFLPAVFEYGLALVNTGSVREAIRLAEHRDADEPFMREVRAAAAERLGQWRAALRAYRGSSWPVHRYRASVVATIVGEPGLGPLRIDEPMRQVLVEGRGEVDAASVVRSSAFLAACMWQPVAHWVLELEQAKLASQRRRFAEADGHYRRALAEAPADARQAVATLRFDNLTWLTDTAPHQPLRLTPEALAAGVEALAGSGVAGKDASTRTWMARETGDMSLLPATLDAWEPYDRACAFAWLGHTARSIDSHIDALCVGYLHRSVIALLPQLHAAGLVEATVALAEIVLRESHAEFLPLLETSRAVQELPRAAAGAGAPDDEAPDDLHGVNDRLRVRLADLSRNGFMNALYAHQLVNQTEHEDLAEELLLRAARQAESVHELLAVAAQLRADPDRHSDEGLWCLAKAYELARERRDRLEIAREYFAYGDEPAGRSILREEKVFEADTELSHSEMIVVLQCALSVDPKDSRALTDRAVRRINEDVAAGTLGRYRSWYTERLLGVISAAQDAGFVARCRRALDPRAVFRPSDMAWSGTAADGWPAVQAQIAAATADGAPPGAEPVPADATFGLRVLAVAHLRAMVEKAMVDARRADPGLTDQETPVVKALDGGTGTRSIAVSDLWRIRLAGGGAPTAELARFFAEERELLAGWEARKQSAGAVHLRRAVRVAEALHSALDGLFASPHPARDHPVVGAVLAAAERDAQHLATTTEQTLRTLRAELAPAVPDGGGSEP